LERIEQYLAFCERRNVSPVRFALAWCGVQPGVTAPIIGPRTMEQLDEYLAALEYAVDDAACKEMDTIFEPGTHVSNYYSANFGPNARWI